MRTAPPAVDVTLGSGRRERSLIGALYGLASGVLLAWLAARLAWPPMLAWPCVVAGTLAGGWLGFRLLSPLTGRLRWDGAGWIVQPAGGTERALQALELRIDLGGWMLLRARRTGASPWSGSCWCGIGAHQAGSAWHGLRLALYQGRREPGEAPPADGATA